jgi:hypothetical protein
LRDQAKDGSEDGASTPADKKAGMNLLACAITEASNIPPTPTMNDTGMILPAHTENHAGTNTPGYTKIEAGRPQPAPTRKEAGRSPEKHTYRRQTGTAKPDLPTTDSSERSSSNDNTKDVELVSWFLVWVAIRPDCTRMLDDETTLLAHHERESGTKTIPIFQ